MTPLTSQWLNAAEAAQHLRIATRTVLRWAKLGMIPAHALSGSQRITYRFRADELDAHLSPPTPTEQTGDE
jgi:excisionase family DNA binding protein